MKDVVLAPLPNMTLLRCHPRTRPTMKLSITQQNSVDDIAVRLVALIEGFSGCQMHEGKTLLPVLNNGCQSPRSPAVITVPHRRHHNRGTCVAANDNAAKRPYQDTARDQLERYSAGLVVESAVRLVAVLAASVKAFLLGNESCFERAARKM